MKWMINRLKYLQTGQSNNRLQHIIAVTFFFSGSALNLTGFVSNLVLGMYFWLNFPSLFFGLLWLIIPFAFPDKTQKLVKPALLFVAFAYMPFMFFINSGIDGPMVMYFIMVIFFIAIAFRDAQRIVVMGLVLVWYLLVLLAGHYFPQFVSEYTGNQSRLLDIFFAFLFISIISAVLASVVLKVYDVEHKRVNELLEELQAKNDELYKLSIRDGLTGLYNRRYFLECLENEIAASNASGLPICLLMIDIDHFKVINDTYGHSVGDEIIKLLVKSTRNCLRDHDVFGRYGGEEFTVLLPNCSFDDGRRIAQRICDNAADQRYRKSIGFTVSVGLAAYIPGESAQRLIDRSDKNLYTAKNNGRNRVEY